MSDYEHRSTASFDVDDEGWFIPVCDCGYAPGAFPTAEDAADAMMHHAYDAGASAAAARAAETQ